MTAPLRWLGVLFALGAASCADGVQLRVQTSPEFAGGNATVSMLGVFHDGRMNVDSWQKASSPVSSALGGSDCAALFTDALQQGDPTLYSEIDTSTQSDGITDDLLAKLAPRAGGDLIVTVSIHGKTRAATRQEMSRIPRAAVQQPGQAQPVRLVKQLLELSASVYSIKQGRSVARMSVVYPSTTFDHAIRRFSTELAAFMPGATCRPWREKAP
jgi:hypothetical protein